MSVKVTILEYADFGGKNGNLVYICIKVIIFRLQNWKISVYGKEENLIYSPVIYTLSQETK